jgi:membrane protease YdiL (CAAX protease family)
MDDRARAQILAIDETQPVSAAPGRRFPGFWISVAWIAMYFAFQAVFGAVIVLAVILTDQSILKLFKAGGSPVAVQTQFLARMGLPLFISVLLAGMATLAVLWFHLRRDGRHQKIGLFAPSRLSRLHTVVLGALLILGMMLLSWAYTTYVVPGQELQAATNALIKSVPKTPFNHLILFLAIAVVAPVIEELLFRGYLQSALMHYMQPWQAIGVASAVFGAIHMQPLAFPMLMLLGAAFGYVYYRTGSLKTNIALHMIQNSLAYLAMAFGLSSGA